jgi:hypothetical protein
MRMIDFKEQEKFLMDFVKTPLADQIGIRNFGYRLEFDSVSNTQKLFLRFRLKETRKAILDFLIVIGKNHTPIEFYPTKEGNDILVKMDKKAYFLQHQLEPA